jgi:glycosyltransferase involved in cell wall biosynthesis
MSDRSGPGASTFASVVVRSCGRPRQVLELMERLLRQSHPHFEIVVCEQTGDPDLHRDLARVAGDRLRLLVRPPLGAAGARNEALRHARGEVLAFIDDDDLPLSDDWLALHLANYDDPLCLGVTARLVDGPAGSPARRLPARARRQLVRHTFWRDTWGWLGFTERKLGVDYLVGTNSSVRRSLVDRIGGWDEGVPTWGEEQSFAFKFARARRAGEHFLFDPRPEVWRRTDIPGGGNRRAGPDWHRRELAARVGYYHQVVSHYFPWRFRLLYPVYLVRPLFQIQEWIWDGDNRWRGIGPRVRASLDVFVRLPGIIWRQLRRGDQDVRRVISVPREAGATPAGAATTFPPAATPGSASEPGPPADEAATRAAAPPR